jgi:serine/threonine protein phosphatase 1
MGQLTYAIGDIHGRLDLLRGALLGIADHVEGKVAKLVFLGDYVDRGPESKEVLDLMIQLQRDPKVVCLKGNHEELMLRALKPGAQDSDFRRWIAAGGEATLWSYGVTSLEEAMDKVPLRHLRWMASLPLTSGDGQRIYVHAGLAPSTKFEKQTEEACLWIREKFLRADEGAFESHVVHGHTPQWDGKAEPASPEILAHRTNLDTGAYFTGILTVGVFDADVAGGPVELIRVRASEDGEATTEQVHPREFAPVEPQKARAGLLGRWRR